MNNVNDIRAFGLSQYAATSVTEVSNVDVDFTEAGLILILYQQHSPIKLNQTLVKHNIFMLTWGSFDC